jgi:hypothetical protein
MSLQIGYIDGITEMARGRIIALGLATGRKKESKKKSTEKENTNVNIAEK